MRLSAITLAVPLLLAVGYAPIHPAHAQARDPAATRGWSDATGGSGADPTRRAGEPPRIYSRQTAFVIPFSVTQHGAESLDVLLYLSTDQGTTWAVHDRQPVTQNQFLFRAPADGEYWFASRTMARGIAAPQRVVIQPELKVVVDTAQPQLDVQASVRPDGAIDVSWEASDAHLAPESLKLEYQPGLSGTWRPIPIDQPAGGPGQKLAGQTRWRPTESSRMVSLRVGIRDKADNAAEATRRLILPLKFTTGSTSRQSRAASSIPADPLARYSLLADEPARSPTAPFQHSTRTAARGQAEGAAVAQTPFAPSAQTPYAPYTPSTQTPYAPPTQPSYSASSSSPYSDPAQSSNNRPKPETVSWPRDNPWDEPSQDSSGADSPATGSLLPPAANTRIARTETSAEPSTTPSNTADAAPEQTRPAGALPPGERPRMTPSKRFNLDYSIDAVGPQGVSKVELWVTRNGGQDWDLWGTDADRESPYLVEVDDEGIYGFRVVIVGKNGLASQSPRPGDLADLWVGVDTAKPIAEITQATYGTGAYAGHLDIRWTAVDDRLASRPITLKFSDRRNGPWTTIASGLPNTGQYRWRVDSRVPDRFFLRLEARDEAGNLGTYQLDQPIQSAGLTPKGRVQGFQPY